RRESALRVFSVRPACMVSVSIVMGTPPRKNEVHHIALLPKGLVDLLVYGPLCDEVVVEDWALLARSVDPCEALLVLAEREPERVVDGDPRAGEIDADPARLDLDCENARLTVLPGLKLVLS